MYFTQNILYVECILYIFISYFIKTFFLIIIIFCAII